MDNTSNICSKPRTSFWTDLLFGAVDKTSSSFSAHGKIGNFIIIFHLNFANMHFMIGTLSNCCLLYKVQLQHAKPGLVAEMEPGQAN